MFGHRKDSQRIFEAHHAQLKAEKIDSLKEKLDNRRKGIVGTGYDQFCNVWLNENL